MPAADQLLSELLGRHLVLRKVSELGEDLDTNFGFSLKPGLGVDSSPCHVISKQSLATIGMPVPEAVARYRPTVLVDLEGIEDPYPEDRWGLNFLQFGTTILAGRKPTERCPEPSWERLGLSGEQLPASSRALQAVRRILSGDTKPNMWFGSYLTVVEPGWAKVGDKVRLYQ